MKHNIQYELKNNQVYLYIKEYERCIFINEIPRKINIVVEVDTNFKAYKDLYEECNKLKAILKLRKAISKLKNEA